jgi:hypothetical protein
MIYIENSVAQRAVFVGLPSLLPGRPLAKKP